MSAAADTTDILLIEDDPAHAELIGRAFQRAPMDAHIRTVTSLRDARDAIEASSPDIVLTDFRLPDGQGIDLLPEDKERVPFPLVVMTSHGDEQVAVEAIKAGALDYVAKSPPAFADMPRIVERALREWGHIVERRRAEEKFAQAQRLESVGRLAAGIAHDFNNLLTAINGSAALIKLELPPDHECVELADNILHSGDRAADLVRQLLAFSRRQVIAPKVVHLGQVVDGLSKMLPRVIGEDVEVEYQVASDLMPVKVDPSQLEQVVLNLAVNARDAMRFGGKLTIRARNVDLSYQAAAAVGLEAGDHVVLSVIDTGTGMTDEIRARIFEPFFTTKEVGKGTGLGLATVFGIVKQSDGGISIESEIGKGTSFLIYLPKAAEGEAGGGEAAVGDGQRQGHETILVVEDDEPVRDLIERALGQQGYTLMVAGDGEAALAMAAQYAGSIDLLLTDVVLPGMSGRSLGDTLVKVRPEMRILFISGYSEDAIAHHGVLSPGVPLLQKPFTPQVLAGELRAVLDQPGRLP